MITAIVCCTLLCTGLGLLLWLGAKRMPHNTQDLAEKINSVLPQTQCAQCNYPGCRPYAEAIAYEDAPINQCPPGGQATINRLAAILGKPALALNPLNGVEEEKKIAFIHEDICIGCKKCIHACPVDAILGAAKKMHTVIAQECTGCDLCVEPCPVDCIDMMTPPITLQNWRTVHPLART